MIHAVGSTLAGLSVHSRKVSTAAHNVANINTDEFKKDRVTIHANASGQPQARVTKVDTPGYQIQGPEGGVETSNVDLAAEMIDIQVGKAGYRANLGVLEAEKDVWDALVDILA